MELCPPPLFSAFAMETKPPQPLCPTTWVFTLTTNDNPQQVSTEFTLSSSKKRKADHEEGDSLSLSLSTELALFDESWISNKIKMESFQFHPENASTETHSKKRKAIHDHESLSTVLTLLDESLIFNKIKMEPFEFHPEKASAETHSKKRKAVHHHESLSTAMTLFDESWISNKIKMEPCLILENTSIDAAANPKIKIGKMRFYTDEDEEEERHYGVSTRLILPFEDPWKIKKTLKESDLGHLSRLLVPKDLINNHFLPFLRNGNGSDGSDCIEKKIESSKGIPVTVWDQDSKSEHQLVFKYWKSSKSFVFIGKWYKDFVTRRSLREGDVVGFYWDVFRQRLHFSLLQSTPIRNKNL